MGASQARLAARARTPAALDAFVEEGGFLKHPLVRPGALEHRSYQVALARGALLEPSLLVMPDGLGKSTVAALVAAERLRQAGGFVLVLVPSAPRARRLKVACAEALSPPLRVGEVTGRTGRGARREAFENAAVVVATPEAVAGDLAAGRWDLGRCSLLVVDEAQRALGDFAYLEVARALRRDRPGGLVLALVSARAGDRRRTAAIMDALGLRRLEVRTRADDDVKGYLAPQPLEVVEVELDGPLQAMQALLEGELDGEVRALAGLGLLPSLPAHLVGRRHLFAAGEALRRQRGRGGGEPFEGLKAHSKAVLLVQALEVCERQGAGALHEFIAGFAAGPDAPRAERALRASMAVEEVLGLARAHRESLHPKQAAAVAFVRNLLREQPGARVLVFAETPQTARALAEALSRGPPLGPGLPARALEGPGEAGSDRAGADARHRETLRAFENGKFHVLVASSIAARGLPVPDADLAVFLDSSPLEVRALARRARTRGRAGRRLVALATRGSRHEGGLEARGSREARRAPSALRVGDAQGPALRKSRLNRLLPLEEAAEGGGSGREKAP